jgi:glycosyltransferase involved in cell wall biosynthesis
MILFGHPTGNPNSHHAGLAHFERGRLETVCIPWFPSQAELSAVSLLPGAQREVARLKRRRFEPLAAAPLLQGRFAEWRRMLVRLVGLGDEKLSYEANDWLMRTMAREAGRSSVTAVHSYEDCSLWQFEEARRLNKACLYDMPIGYYPWWDEKQKFLAKSYPDWIPAGGVPSSRYVRPEQKVKEMELADLVLVACGFVEKMIREFYPDKKIAIAPYGVDAGFWAPVGAQHGAWSMEHGGEEQERLRDEKTAEGCRTETGCLGDQKTKRPRGEETKKNEETLRFIYAGGCSIRKGIPVLLEAWEKAQLREAELTLVGSWQLAVERLKQLPRGVRFVGPVGPEKLRELYRESDVFVFPSFFEGFGLVILEAMACGLPVIASDRSAGPDVLDESCGRVVAAGDLEQLVETLRWFGVNRDKLPAMKRAARSKAETFTWENYRTAVSEAVAPFVMP